MKTRDCLCGMLLVGVALLVASCKPEEEPLYGRAGNLLEDGKVWSGLYVYRAYSTPSMLECAEPTRRWIGGDTVVEDLIWKKSFRAESGDTSHVVFDCLLRQEGDKLYGRFVNGLGDVKMPKLIFDFGKKAGDTLFLGWTRSEVVVLDVYDTVLPGGNGRLQRAMDVLLLRGSVGIWEDAIQMHDTWVEGIGSMTAGLDLKYTATGWPGMEFVLCCETEDEWLYQNPAFGTCYIDDFEDVPEDVLFN